MISGVQLAGDGLFEQRQFSPPLRAGEELAPAIQSMLKHYQLRVADLGLIVHANGPGSFTGLRVGLATAKGLASGGRVPLVDVCTLDVLAWQAAIADTHVRPVMPARRGEVYTAAYRASKGTIEREGDFQWLSHEDFLTTLHEDCLVLGPALNDLRDQAAGRCRLAQDADCALSLSWLVELGLRRFREEGAADLNGLEPMYLQEFRPTRGRKRV